MGEPGEFTVEGRGTFRIITAGPQEGALTLTAPDGRVFCQEDRVATGATSGYERRVRDTTDWMRFRDLREEILLLGPAKTMSGHFYEVDIRDGGAVTGTARRNEVNEAWRGSWQETNILYDADPGDIEMVSIATQVLAREDYPKQGYATRRIVITRGVGAWREAGGNSNAETIEVEQFVVEESEGKRTVTKINGGTAFRHKNIKIAPSWYPFSAERTLLRPEEAERLWESDLRPVVTQAEEAIRASSNGSLLLKPQSFSLIPPDMPLDRVQSGPESFVADRILK
ncbi:MAG: hypothetical protein Q8N98_03080 [bacterium]|nr:hypothetical protein [bacterium]